jgi:hypothetical protein
MLHAPHLEPGARQSILRHGIEAVETGREGHPVVATCSNRGQPRLAFHEEGTAAGGAGHVHAAPCSVCRRAVVEAAATAVARRLTFVVGRLASELHGLAAADTETIVELRAQVAAAIVGAAAAGLNALPDERPAHTRFIGAAVGVRHAARYALEPGELARDLAVAIGQRRAVGVRPTGARRVTALIRVARAKDRGVDHMLVQAIRTLDGGRAMHEPIRAAHEARVHVVGHHG